MSKDQLLMFKKIFDNSFYPYQYDIEKKCAVLNEHVPRYFYFNNVAMAEKITKTAKENLNKLIEQYGKGIVESN